MCRWKLVSNEEKQQKYQTFKIHTYILSYGYILQNWMVQSHDECVFNSLRYHQLCSLVLIAGETATTGSTPTNQTTISSHLCWVFYGYFSLSLSCFSSFDDKNKRTRKKSNKNLFRLQKHFENFSDLWCFHVSFIDGHTCYAKKLNK